MCIIPEAAGLPVDTTCTWQYTAGNHAIPEKVTTEENHILTNIPDSISELKVFCVDTNGTLYFGTEGKERPIND